MPDKIPFDYLGAKKAGYKDEEIQSYLKQNYNFDFDIIGAKGSGYSDKDIADYILAYESPSKKKVESPFDFKRQLPRGYVISANQSGLEAPFTSAKNPVERENYAAKYEEAQSAASNVEKYPGTLMYDMNIQAAENQDGDFITLKRDQTSLPHVAGISLGGNINVDRKKYIEEQKALRDSVIVKNNELKANAAKALEGVRGNINRNIEEITNNLDNFTTTSAEGDKIPDVNKINEFARKKAEEKGLSDEGYYKNLLYNEAKANVTHKIIEPKVVERLNENYKKKYGKSIDEETTQEALKGFSKDEEIISKAKVQAKSVQEIISKEAKEEVNALNNAVTQEADAMKQQYQQLAQTVQTQDQADELYSTTLASINKLNEDFLKQQNLINSKYNARYRRQVGEITKIAEAKIKSEAEKYQYKRSPDFQKRIEAEYKEAYTQVLKERDEKLEARDKMYNPVVNFGRTFLTSLGGAIKGISSTLDFDTGKVFGDYLSEQYQHGTTQIKEFKDLLDITKVSKSMGSLGGGMTPALIAAGATTLATGGAGAPTGVTMLAGGFASWAAETAQMSGQMYEDKFAETGSASAAEKAAKQTLDSQVLLMPLYALDGLPFMGKAIKLGKNVPTRILLGGTIETATEFAQEYPQNLFEEAIKNDQDYMEGLNLSSVERAKDTFLNIAPTFLLGGTGQATGAISEARQNSLAKAAAKAFAVKSDFKNIPVNFQDQYILDIIQRKGKNFANAFVGSLFSNGMIDETQSNKLSETIKLSEETLANASKYGLNPAEQKVYTSLALKRADALAMAEAETDPVLKMAAMTNVSSIENDMVNIATGNKTDYTVVTMPNNEQYVMTAKEAEKAIQDEKFQDAYYNGDIKVETYGKRGVVQETLDEIDAQKKKERKDKERTPEQVIIDAANEGHFGFTGEMVKSGQVTPQQAILELAMQKYGVLGDGSVDEKGGRDISMKTSIAVDEAVTQVFPNRKSVVDAVKGTSSTPVKNDAVTQEGAAENVVPSTLETISSPINTQTDGERQRGQEGLLAQTPSQTETAGGEVVPPALPPKEGATTDQSEKPNKALATRLVNAKNTPQAAKEGIASEGLTYEPQSQQEAEDLAKSIIDEIGIDDAVLRARAQEFGGDVNTLIQTESLNRLADFSEKATTPEERLAYDKQFAEIGIQLDEWLRKQGRGIAAINFFYKKSPLGMQMIENARRKQDFDQWSKPKDKSWKEFFDEMMKEPEFEDLVKAEVKKERAEERKTRKEKVHKDIDAAAQKWANRLKPKTDTGDAKKSGIGVDEIMKAAAATMKAAYDAGEAVAKIVQDAIDYISEKLGNSEWDTEGFRKEWEEKLRDKTAKKKLTDEEIKSRVLDRFRKKLKGLSDKQKEDVVRRSFQQIVENGGLDFDEFKGIIADITGRGEMTKEESDKLKELVKTLNSVEDAATKVRQTRTKEDLNEFKKKQLEAGRASKDLSKLLYNKPNILKRLTTMMQLNTLGVAALVNNPIYNIWNQTTLRFPIGVVNTLIDGTISSIAKVMGKKYTSETNVIYSQKEFFRKLGLGLKEAGQQFATGLDRQDYTQKELHGQQIRPLSSAKDLWEWVKGKRPLTKAQIADKVLQASPQGWIAEAIARILNLGDKPQRFAAEGAQAAAFSKALGISDIDYDLFIEFPREEAYRVYKQQGLSDEEAGKKADYVRDTIVKEGQRSTFQQDNLLNDTLNKIFGGEGSGSGSLLKAIAVSPYIKIPSNAFWSYFNLVNPEVALLQSAYYGTKAAARKRNPNIKFPFDKSGNSAAKDLHESRYWLAHAAVGIALRSVITSLVLAGVFRSSNDEDDTKKERQGEQYYEPQGGINLTKLAALLRGDDPTQVKGGLVVNNRWLGHWGSVGNTIAKRYENMTPEQKQNADDYWNMIGGNLGLSSLKELEQGVFGNTSSLLSALQNPEYGLKRYGISTINMFTNIIHPAAFSQLSKAELPYVSQTKADTFGQELKNTMLQRSSWLRKLADQYPPSKVGIWGDKIEKKDNLAGKLFGWSNVDKNAFARPIYDDVVRTNDIGYFPPAVSPNLNGVKLNVEQQTKLETYIGEARKGYIAPFINDQAVIDGFEVTYSKLNDDDKKYVLRYLYGLGKDDGEERFYLEYPDLKQQEKETDYEQDQKEEIFKLLQKYKQ